MLHQGTVIAKPELYKVLDPRSPLGKMRRRQLQTVCIQRGVEFSPDEGAEILRQRLQSAGITGNEPDLCDPHGNPTVQPSPLTTSAPEQPDFSRMKMPALRKLCKQRGIEQKNTDKRDDLIRKLNG